MSAIPEDIMETAQKAWREADGKILKTDAYVVIALAILAERERSRTLLSEADQREKDARRVALEEAAKVVDVAAEKTPWEQRRNSLRRAAKAIRKLQSEER
ncbi:hypothetical protein HRR99_03035 [Agrobacterium vaccinii]|uniref:hypothetical protein n=1 Tax=Agrobacterium vaccinii TaxID=2735528 RepID=UPI001E2922F5|nr:hypothetical protein [Agrobacterium vaccinii]UHS60566.1 hypothetical protein HRR99_03035 [Agrobacterium vaccinii]